MVEKIRSWLQQIKQHPFITTGIIVVLFALITFTFAVIKFGWNWTGFISGEGKVTTTMITPGTTVTTEQQPGKTLWDWLGLLGVIAIPVVVGLGAAWYTAQQGKVSDRENKDNQRETALQAYINNMSELLLENHLGKLTEHLGELTENDTLTSEEEQVREIARVRTLTVLPRLDGMRKRSVLLFLHEAGLLDRGPKGIRHPIINLFDADFSQACLSSAHLFGVSLSKANLSEANLSRTYLRKAEFHRADLRKANLSNKNLSEFFYLDEEPNLWEANLTEADLSGADLSGADLSGTILSKVRSCG